MKKEKFIKFLKRFFCLPPAPTLLISIPSFVFVFFVLANGTILQAIAYIAYLLSAYALIIMITGMPDIVKWIQKGVENHPFTKKALSIPVVAQFVSETDFRTEVGLYPSLVINLVYAGIKLFSGIRYHSVWFGTLSIYYILLAIMRFSLLHHVRRGKKQEDYISELKICRLCGMILMILDWALSGMIVLVVRKNSGFVYPGILIYAMALYTFYAVIAAIISAVKYRKYKSPVVSVSKVITLTAALVSMLSLETAMLTQFGDTRDATFRQMMMGITGVCVSLFVLGMSIYIIVRTTKQIKKRRENT